MALTEIDVPSSLWWDVVYHGYYGANGAISDSFCPGVPWKLKDIRVKISDAFASIEYLIMKISSVLDSYHNIVFYSLNVSGSTDIFIHYSDPIMFLSDDHLLFELSTVSGVHTLGFIFDVWAAKG